MTRWKRIGLTATIATTVVSGLIGGAADASARGKLQTYASPTYGVTLEYDAATWSIFQENDGSDGDNVDFLGLESDEIRGGFMIQTYDTQTDADDCIVDLIEFGIGEGEDPELREDEDGEPMEGSARGYAYAAYTFLDDGIYVGGYFGCQEFGNDIGMIAFILLVNSQDFDDALELVEPIIESVDDSDAHAAGEGDDDRDRDDEDDRDKPNDDDRDEDDDKDGGEVADTGTYESELFGYTLPYNAENWTLDETRTEDGNESASFDGPNGEVLTVMSFPAGGSQPSEFTDYYIQSFSEKGDVEIELYVDPDTGDTIERDNRREAYALYTFEYDGEEFLLYTHAVTSANGKFAVLVVGTSLISSFDLLEEEVFPLLDQIEY